MKQRGHGKSAVKWRLKRTLSRKTEFRPIEAEDMRYIWAAYKKGCLASMGGLFATEALTSVGEFRSEFEQEILANYHAAWTLFAQTPKGFLPAGLVLGFWSHPEPRLSPFMIVGDMIWFAWTSKRNRVECAVRFFNDIRDDFPMVEYAEPGDKKFFEMIAKHGVMRRIGTTYSVYPDKPASIFETRAK